MTPMTPTRCKCGELHGLISKNPFFLGGGFYGSTLGLYLHASYFLEGFFKNHFL